MPNLSQRKSSSHEKEEEGHHHRCIRTLKLQARAPRILISKAPTPPCSLKAPTPSQRHKPQRGDSIGPPALHICLLRGQAVISNASSRLHSSPGLQSPGVWRPTPQNPDWIWHLAAVSLSLWARLSETEGGASSEASFPSSRNRSLFSSRRPHA